jgi:hypothetical protein
MSRCSSAVISWSPLAVKNRASSGIRPESGGHDCREIAFANVCALSSLLYANENQRFWKILIGWPIVNRRLMLQAAAVPLGASG